MTAPLSRPADRYGDRPPSRTYLIAAVAIGVALVIVAVFFISRASDAQIHADALSWTEPRDGTMTATIEVVRRPNTEVVCDLVAVDLRQIIVGQTELVVPATSQRRSVVDATIVLQGDAVAVSVTGCKPQPAG